MKLAGYTFRPRWWGLVLAAAGCAAGIALGNWQWGRAAERRAAAQEIAAAEHGPALELPRERVDPGPLARKRFAVRGEFLPGFTVLLDNRMHRGQVGYVVVQPLRTAASDLHVLVLRGWIAAGAQRDHLPAVATPQGEQRIEGIALDHLPQYLVPAGAIVSCRPGAAPCVWQNLAIEPFAAWSGLALQPLLLEQHSGFADGLVRDWERPEAGFRKNEMYALQWYSLACLAVVLFLVLSFRRDKPAAG